MSTYLLASTPFAGHVHPMAGLARALVERGHEVLFYTGRKYRGLVEDSGAHWVGWQAAPDFDDTDPAASFPAMRGTRGPRGMFVSFRELFFGTAPQQARDIFELHGRYRVDAMIAEGTCFGPSLVHEKAGIPWATFSLSPLGLPSKHLPPPGLPLSPGRTPLGRGRDAALRAAMDSTVNAGFRWMHNRARTRAGLPPTERLGLEGAWSQQLLLAQGVAELQPPRPDLPAHVRFIGDAAAGTRRPVEPPAWLDRLDGTRPVVHVSEGTLGNDRASLVARTVSALHGTDVQLVVGGRHRAGELPEEVVAQQWVPHDLLFPRTDLFVSNGGYGGVLAALNHGVPVVVVPGGGDKPLVAQNLAASGAGRALLPRGAGPERLRRTVREALADRGLASRAGQVGRAITAAGGAHRAAEFCAELVTEK